MFTSHFCLHKICSPRQDVRVDCYCFNVVLTRKLLDSFESDYVHTKKNEKLYEKKAYMSVKAARTTSRVSFQQHICCRCCFFWFHHYPIIIALLVLSRAVFYEKLQSCCGPATACEMPFCCCCLCFVQLASSHSVFVCRWRKSLCCELYCCLNAIRPRWHGIA